MSNFELDPTDELDFESNWTPWLDSANSETISTSTWTVEAGLTKMSGAGKDPTINAGRTRVWLTGGEKGVTYRVTNQITTSAGRKASRTMLIDVTER